MTPKTCIYKYGTLLDGWDDDAKKYKEAGTGELHTRDRCEAFKANLEEKKKQEDQEKNDHGNEDRWGTSQKIENPIQAEYVDHTAKGVQQFKVFSNTSADILTIDGNEWIKSHPEYNVKLIGQLQYDNGTFAITMYYEEVTKQ